MNDDQLNHAFSTLREYVSKRKAPSPPSDDEIRRMVPRILELAHINPPQVQRHTQANRWQQFVATCRRRAESLGSGQIRALGIATAAVALVALGVHLNGKSVPERWPLVASISGKGPGQGNGDVLAIRAITPDFSGTNVIVTLTDGATLSGVLKPAEWGPGAIPVEGKWIYNITVAGVSATGTPVSASGVLGFNPIGWTGSKEKPRVLLRDVREFDLRMTLVSGGITNPMVLNLEGESTNKPNQ